MPPDRSLQIAARPGHAGPSKPQQRFNTLTRKVAQLKAALQAWSQGLPAIYREVAEHQQRLAEQHDVASEVVRRLDQLAADRSITKRERTQLRQIICEIAIELLQDGASDDLKAIYNKHSRGDYDTETATENAMKAHMMKTLLQQDFGMDFGDTRFDSLEDLERATAEQFAAADRDAEQRRQAADVRKAQRKKSARQVASEARRETQAAQIGKTLQEIYRKLALLLHPDHERDPVERARKTELMQQVNVAYERKDLVQLLELQLRFEQVDQAHINSIAEDRLAHFNSLLAEQVRELQRELASVEEPWRLQLDTPPQTKLTPARVQAALQRDLREMAHDLARTRRDLEQLADPRNLKAWLRAAWTEDASAARDPFNDWFR
jgi:hypothetical protein